MGRTRLVICLATFLGLAAGGLRAQGLQPRLQSIKNISVGVGEQVPNGFVGAGARAMGMGGVQIASVMDGTALYWNPAALARVRRLEILGGLAYAQPHASADVGIQTVGGLTHAGAGATVTALNAFLLTVPYPTYRGGLTFALGVVRPEDYQFRARRTGIVDLNGASYLQDDEVRQSGGISRYALGIGIEVAPTVSVGVAVGWDHGTVEVTRPVSLLEQNQVQPDSLTGEYRQNNNINGLALTVGTTVRLPAGFSLGAVALRPVTYEIKGTWNDEYVEAIGPNKYTYPFPSTPNRLAYNIVTPWQLGLGLTWATYAVSLGADAWYVDWRQARFEGAPYDVASGIDADRFFEDRYRQKVRWHVGGELLLPWIKTSVRAGYYSDPDPFYGPTLDTQGALSYRRTAGYFTLGAGWLIEDVLTADVAFVFGGDQYVTGDITEHRTTRRAFFTVAFRL